MAGPGSPWSPSSTTPLCLALTRSRPATASATRESRYRGDTHGDGSAVRRISRAQATGKCEGRKSWAEINPELVREAKRLRRRKRGNSLRAIAAELAARGYVNENGKEFSVASVASMLGT